MTHPTRWLACMAPGLALALVASGATAQPPEPPFMAELFPPQLIMQHGSEIGIRAEQRSAISQAVAATQAQVLELQWDLQEAAQSLGRTLAGERVDEEAALDAATRVMELEGRVKRAHLGLLIRIKNQLDAQQQQQLRALRTSDAGPR